MLSIDKAFSGEGFMVNHGRRGLMGAALWVLVPFKFLAEVHSARKTAASVRVADAKLSRDVIDAKDIISGSPQAGDLVFSTSADSRETSGIWSCTPGSFHWTFDTDETSVILQGRVTVQMEDGVTLHLGPGDLAFFPNGQKSIWKVEENLRKVYVLYKNG
jgi:uncharacterized protein